MNIMNIFAKMKISTTCRLTSIMLLLLYETNFYSPVTSTVVGSIVEPFISDSLSELRERIKGTKHGVFPVNSQILDPENIKSTRERIIQCTEGSENCGLAKDSKYRNINGTCNNLKHPRWGASRSCYRRILPYDYNSTDCLPRISSTGKDLPNPRLISTVFHKERNDNTDGRTTHFMEWGQMVSHDMSLNELIMDTETGANFNCCLGGVIVNENCTAYPSPPDDPFYSQFGLSCLDYSRTKSCPYCKSGERSHMNTNTAYHDLSLVYGSYEKIAFTLRRMEGGKLKADNSCKSSPMLPRVAQEELCESLPGEEKCYHSGDLRTNQNPFLLTIHTYLFRHHNFICEELSKVNPQWDDETLYQEARRINIAQAQFITYDKYLPIVLGEAMQMEGIDVLPGNQYTNYNSTLDAGITDEFSAVAARFGHTLIPGTFSEIDPATHTHKKVHLRNYYYNPYTFPCQGFEKIVKGMTVDEETVRDQFLSDDVRDFLYQRVYLNETYAFDLATLSIIRGRDHGIPGYTYYVAHLLNIHLQTFNDLMALMPKSSMEGLKKLYKSVHDIDFYSAGFAEYSALGALVGPTFNAILADQFKRTKFGDRYWFEHGNEVGSFTPDQLQEIKQSSLAKILCDITQMTEIQTNVFFPPSISNPVVSCNNIREFNFNLWKE